MLKYYTWYNNIVNHRKNNALPADMYGEFHHVIPRCLGGTNNDDNLVKLTAREHFICHYLLTKMYEVGSNEWYKMHHAFMIMAACSNGKRYVNSRLYNACRANFSKTMSQSQLGTKNSQFGKIWITNISLERNQKIDAIDLDHWLAIGWTTGRIQNFQKYREHKIAEINTKIEKQLHIKARRDKTDEKHKLQAEMLFQKYKESNCMTMDEFIKNGHYDKSVVWLSKLWTKYIPEYKPRVKKRKQFPKI